MILYNCCGLGFGVNSEQSEQQKSPKYYLKLTLRINPGSVVNFFLRGLIIYNIESVTTFK